MQKACTFNVETFFSRAKLSLCDFNVHACKAWIYVIHILICYMFFYTNILTGCVHSFWFFHDKDLLGIRLALSNGNPMKIALVNRIG